MTNPKLSNQQHRVLVFAARGMTLAETASQLDVSRATVAGYCMALLRKLDARNIAHAVAIGYDQGLLISTGVDHECE